VLCAASTGACDTFRGELRADGVVGIARAFVAAGARTLVASLWKVDDAPTRELMRRFYGHLFPNRGSDPPPVAAAASEAGGLQGGGGGGGDAAVAMQRAMCEMIARGGRRVVEWAGFVVYGLAETKLNY